VTAPAPTTTDRSSSPLDRRRDQAAAAAGAAEQAQAGVTELDHRLATNANLTRQQSQALRNAVAEANRLKRTLKAGKKERDRLTKARKKAATRAGKAKAKAESADEKYSRTVLAELVRREKERDRASASVPAAEQSTVTATAAKRTAARRTAAAAGVSAPRT
jgi:chromosome segregation ATPase